MSKHTPGPWHVWLDTSVHANGHQLGNPTSCIVSCLSGDAAHAQEVKANALLVAAAPDLLSALVAMLHTEWGKMPGDLGEFEIRSDVLEQAREAIRKAQGVK